MLGPYYVTSEARLTATYGPPCGLKATAASVVIDGRRLACRVEAVEPFQAWETIRAHHGYQLTGTDTGIYSCRHQRHSTLLPWSVHAWALALDANWLENPAGNKLVTDIPQPMIHDLQAVRTRSGARVFRWGGDWDSDGLSTDHSYVDAMHWEVIAHPLDLATGIIIPQLSPPAPPSEVRMYPTLDLSNVTASSSTWVRGELVKTLQGLLVARGFAPANTIQGDRVDGIAGPGTRAALGLLQTAHSLTKDFIVGEKTWKALEAF